MKNKVGLCGILPNFDTKQVKNKLVHLKYVVGQSNKHSANTGVTVSHDSIAQGQRFHLLLPFNWKHETRAEDAGGRKEWGNRTLEGEKELASTADDTLDSGIYVGVT